MLKPLFLQLLLLLLLLPPSSFFFTTNALSRNAEAWTTEMSARRAGIDRGVTNEFADIGSWGSRECGPNSSTPGTSQCAPVVRAAPLLGLLG